MTGDARRKAQTVTVRTDIGKLIHAISFVIQCAQNRGKKFSQYDIVKSLFFADRSHLNRYGRLITNDNYIAMKHGPVPSLGYDLLKSDDVVLNDFGISELPWTMSKGKKGVNYFSDSQIKDFDELLSESDQEALDSAVTTVSSLSFGQIRKLTHEDNAYVDAWEDEGSVKAFPMSLGLLFDAADYNKANIIAEFSEIAAE